MGIDHQSTPWAPPAVERPLSPHLQVWRWHITMLTSILHRVTGVVLYGGALVMTGWVIALATGPQVFAAYKALLASPPGKAALFAVTISIFYHLANGVRHLVWDTGHGLGVKAASATAAGVFIFVAAATVAVWVFATSGAR